MANERELYVEIPIFEGHGWQMKGSCIGRYLSLRAMDGKRKELYREMLIFEGQGWQTKGSCM